MRINIFYEDKQLRIYCNFNKMFLWLYVLFNVKTFEIGLWPRIKFLYIPFNFKNIQKKRDLMALIVDWWTGCSEWRALLSSHSG